MLRVEDAQLLSAQYHEPRLVAPSSNDVSDLAHVYVRTEHVSFTSMVSGSDEEIIEIESKIVFTARLRFTN